MWAFYSSLTHMDWRQAVEWMPHTRWIWIPGMTGTVGEP